jgi:hypothetical protein
MTPTPTSFEPLGTGLGGLTEGFEFDGVGDLRERRQPVREG